MGKNIFTELQEGQVTRVHAHYLEADNHPDGLSEPGVEQCVNDGISSGVGIEEPQLKHIGKTTAVNAQHLRDVVGKEGWNEHNEDDSEGSGGFQVGSLDRHRASLRHGDLWAHDAHLRHGHHEHSRVEDHDHSQRSEQGDEEISHIHVVIFGELAFLRAAIELEMEQGQQIAHDDQVVDDGDDPAEGHGYFHPARGQYHWVLQRVANSQVAVHRDEHHVADRGRGDDEAKHDLQRAHESHSQTPLKHQGRERHYGGAHEEVGHSQGEQDEVSWSLELPEWWRERRGLVLPVQGGGGKGRGGNIRSQWGNSTNCRPLEVWNKNRL